MTNAPAEPVNALGRLLDLGEAARFTGMKPSTISVYVHRKQIPHIRIGPRLVRFPERALAEWLASRFVAVGGAR